MRKILIHILKQSVCFMVVVGITHAATLKVGKEHPYHSLQKAVDSAKDYDTVLVYSGTYQEGNIAIRKPLYLIGINQPVLDGLMTIEPLSIRSPYVTVKGFVVRNSGSSSMTDIAGIKVYNTHHVSIIDNVLDNNLFGIYMQGSKNCRIENNTIQAYRKTEQLSGNGVHAWKCDSLHIKNNRTSGNRDGIYLEFVTHTEVRENLSHNNIRYGLHFMFSHDNAYYNNIFRHNGAGVAVMYTKRVHMQGNTFEQNWGDAAYGLLLKEIMDSRIEHNKFIKNTTGILMESSNRIHLENNSFQSNGWALKIQSSCVDNKLTGNNFTGNTFDVASNGTLMLNNFERNFWDKYEGYDLDKNGEGDIPYRPVSLFSMIIEKYPTAMLLFRSFMVTLFDRTEKVVPSITPEGLKDNYPLMKPVNI